MLTPKNDRHWLLYLLEQWLRKRRLMRQRDRCDVCGGTGVLFNFTQTAATKVVDTEAFSLPPTIERCDTCLKYESDDQAAAAVMRLFEEMVQ